jgi:hypothetical protein
MADDNLVSRAYEYVKDKAVSTAKDLAAKGTTIKDTGPPRGRSAGLDMPKLAQDAADRALGKRSSSKSSASKKRTTKAASK